MHWMLEGSNKSHPQRQIPSPLQGTRNTGSSISPYFVDPPLLVNLRHLVLPSGFENLDSSVGLWNICLQKQEGRVFTSGPTGGATSSAKISWNSGLSKSEDFAVARVCLEPEVCWVLAEFGPPSDSRSPVSVSDCTNSKPLEPLALSVSTGLSSGLSSQSGCAKSSRTVRPGCRSTSWILPRTLDQMSTTTSSFLWCRYPLWTPSANSLSIAFGPWECPVGRRNPEWRPGKSAR